MEVEEELINSVPKYVIDLDQAPKDRWTHILKDYKSELYCVEKKIDELQIPKYAQSVLGWFKSKVYYLEELQGIADQIGWEVSKLIMMQLVYEASAHCTSIIAQDSQSGLPLHIRTMEWEMPFLRPITIEVAYQKGGKIIAQSSTWVGYVGVLTGLNQGVSPFSISVNFRIIGDSFLENLKKAVSSAWPIGFLVREILTDENLNYEKAEQYLKNSSLIAPVYFTLCGSEKLKGTLITRNRDTDENQITLNETSQKFIVQTNMDHWKTDGSQNIMDSIGRDKFAKKQLTQITINKPNLWKMMSKEPIMSEVVVYGTYLNPSLREIETRLTVGKQKMTFIVRSQKQIDQDTAKATCKLCHASIPQELNSRGLCAHPGKWHSTYDDCSYVKCSFGLGIKNIGNQHWSCCFSLLQNSPCPKSSFHDLQ